MKKVNVKVVISLVLSLLIFIQLGGSITASTQDTTSLKEGPTVLVDPESPTGYTVTFVYHNPDAERVQLAGDLTLLDSNTNDGTRSQPEDWESGMYHTGGVEFTRDMEKDEYGNWSVSIPMHAGALNYWYRVWDPEQDWENKRIWDPASTQIRPNSTDDNSTPFRVRNNNDVLDVVYVPYDEKQNDPTLKSRAKYQLPVENPAEKGTVQYIPYTTILGDEGFNLGVYLPAGYDPDRAEPYKVVYAGHGIFGDETDWLIPVSAPNILDNMIANGELEPTVFVTMGNHFTNKSFGFDSYNMQNAADNLVQTILPKIEADYNVSEESTGRAYIGFSMGAMTGASVMNSYASTFDYYGFFAGMGTYTDDVYNNIADLTEENEPFVFMGRGSFEGDLSTWNIVRDNFRAMGIPSETALVPGAHDGMTAGQLFTIFAKDYLWKTNGSEEVDGVQSVNALTDMGWWGQRVTGVVLEFTDEVDTSTFTVDDFTVRDTSFNPYFDIGDVTDPSFMKDQQVTDVFTVADPQLLLDNKRPSAPGKYVVVMLEPNFNGGTKISVEGGMMTNPNQPTEITIHQNIYSTSGALLAEASNDPMKLTGPAVVNRGVDQFVHEIVEDPTVGLPLNYHYRLPTNYDSAKKYPLVVYLNGYGQGYFPDANNIGGQIISDGTPQFWFNEQDIPVSEDVIFLAPQSTRVGQSSQTQAEQVAELIENFSMEFAVDNQRVYGYTLSYGSTLGWWLAQNRADLFTAIIQTSFMTNDQEHADGIAEAEIPMWLFQGQYDHLFGSEDAIASYQRIVDAYKARGLNDEQIDELIKITIYPDSVFETQGPGLSTPSGPYADLIPDLPGPRIDRHAAMVPAFQDPATSEWLLAQRKTADDEDNGTDDNDEESPGDSNGRPDDTNDNDAGTGTDDNDEERPDDEDGRHDGTSDDDAGTGTIDNDEDSGKSGQKLPDTATGIYNMFFIGFLVLLLGVVLMFLHRKKMGKVIK